MKNTLLSFLLFISAFCFSQEYKTNTTSVTGVFEAKDKSKSELFSLINKWLSINYKSSKHVIQLNDLESGTIIVKGINTVKTKNALKKLYPNSSPEHNFYEFNHLIEINVKDNKFRITFTLIDIVSGVSLNDRFSMECINLQGVDQNSVDFYNEKMDSLLRTGLVGKKKRDEFKSESKDYLTVVNNDILQSAKEIMLSIDETVKESISDKW
jgi:hypothetical protein